jgi:hypothetical protein
LVDAALVVAVVRIDERAESETRYCGASIKRLVSIDKLTKFSARASLSLSGEEEARSLGCSTC